MNSPQEIIDGLAERLAQMIKGGMAHNNAIVELTNQLERNANMQRNQATALVELAIEAYANKYENRRVFNDQQLVERISLLSPGSADILKQAQQGNIPKSPFG